MQLTVDHLCKEAHDFSQHLTSSLHPSLLGVTDGKAVGTYVEQNFIKTLAQKGYVFAKGNAASGLDFPDMNIDIKVTSIKQPQSSCPFRSLRQKIYGLGYGLIVFVYDKKDDHALGGAILNIRDTIFVAAERTADFQMTVGLTELLDRGANEEELASFMQSRSLTVDFYELTKLAQEVLINRPNVGYLTISPALQWRLNYARAIQHAGSVRGLDLLYRSVEI